MVVNCARNQFLNALTIEFNWMDCHLIYTLFLVDRTDSKMVDEMNRNESKM